MLRIAVCAAVGLAIGGCATQSQSHQQMTFSSPEQAANALATAARENDTKTLAAIAGPEGKGVVSSGDPIADRQTRERFAQAYDEKHTLVQEDDSTVIVIGKQDWPFPIPLVKEGNVWHFDTAKGKEEILNRRIGANELYTIQTCLAVVDAQREYVLREHDKSGLLTYARKFISDPGTQDGLYWKTEAGQPLSPLGELAAQSENQAYKGQMRTGQPTPFHGYYYKMLYGQGRSAPGGAYEYVVNGEMIGGFAVVAWPAEYGNSGIMTFMVGHDGVVYQKNLGGDTAAVAAAMTEFDPDDTWTKAASIEGQ